MDARVTHSNHIIIFVVCFLHAQILVVLGARPIDKGITVTTNSPIVGNWTADKIVDGDARQLPYTCDCCAATQWVMQPQFDVDLGKVYNMSRVDVIGRGGPGDKDGGEGHTLIQLQISIGMTSTSLTQLYLNKQNIYVVRVLLSDPLLVRYMRLKLLYMTQNFVVCELHVYAECNAGTYSPNCDECGHCLNGAICNKEDGACVSCEAGYKGARCDQNCSAVEYGYDCAEACGFCNNGDACDRINGTCTDCQDGYMLPYCKDCAEYGFGGNCTICHCAGGPCNKTSGVCPPGGCTSGYKGARCDTECDTGTYGLDCYETCGSCYNRTCNNINGSCPQSFCEAGFRGDTCKQICAHGSYGQNCSKTCGYCTNGETCDPITGVCLHGCSDGYNGTLCKTTCPSGTFGKDCNSTCGNCFNGDVCRFDNGHCESGCEPGYKPPMCLSAAGPESASKLSPGEIAGSAFGGIFVIALIFVAVIFVYKQRRKKYGPREQATESGNG